MYYKENPGEMGAVDDWRPEISKKISLKRQFRIRHAK